MNIRSLQVKDNQKNIKQLHITEAKQPSKKVANDNSIFVFNSQKGNIHTINGKAQRNNKTKTYLLDGNDVNFFMKTNLAITKKSLSEY